MAIGGTKDLICTCGEHRENQKFMHPFVTARAPHNYDNPGLARARVYFLRLKYTNIPGRKDDCRPRSGDARGNIFKLTVIIILSETVPIILFYIVSSSVVVFIGLE